MKIRHAQQYDISELSNIEKASYPELEGASRESITERVAAFPDCFWILEEQERMLGFINGMITDQADLTDEMYEDAKMHNPDGAWQMIFSVVTAPTYRNKGYASLLMERVIEDTRTRGKKGIVLTCKERLLPFYGKFGFLNEGVSQSTHGDVMWYQMRLTF